VGPLWIVEPGLSAGKTAITESNNNVVVIWKMKARKSAPHPVPYKMVPFQE
jgi:hypothetical protein